MAPWQGNWTPWVANIGFCAPKLVRGFDQTRAKVASLRPTGSTEAKQLCIREALENRKQENILFREHLVTSSGEIGEDTAKAADEFKGELESSAALRVSRLSGGEMLPYFSDGISGVSSSKK